MPRRKVFTDSERSALLAIPSDASQMSKYYLFSEIDISIINQKRGIHNKIGFAILICCMRYPGFSINNETPIPTPLIELIAGQLKIKDYSSWRKYFNRESTRWEHISELKLILKLESFTANEYELYLNKLILLAKQTDKGMVLAEAFINFLRADSIIIPDISVIERLCAEAITIGNQEFYKSLIGNLSKSLLTKFDELLSLRAPTRISYLVWLQQPANIPKTKHILSHMERLRYIHNLGLPESLGKNVPHHRLIKLAKEGRNMFARDIEQLEFNRKYATISAIILETSSSIIDEIVDLNDRILGSIFNKAKNRHNHEFQDHSRSINEKLNLYLKIGKSLIIAKENNTDPFHAIEAIISWDQFVQSVQDTQPLAKPTHCDSLYRITAYYSWIKRYIQEFLELLEFKASQNAAELIKALEIIREMYQKKLRKVPDHAPVSFIRKQWHALVFKENNQLDRQFYEFALLSELKNALRSGDIWVVGSRKYKDFDEYLLDQETFDKLKIDSPLATIGTCDFNRFIEKRINVLTENLEKVNRLAIKNKLPDASINKDGLKITPLTNSVPDEAAAFNEKIYALLPKIKITSLLQEVDSWVNYTDEFTHLKNESQAKNKSLLLTVILADAINLGLSKMAEACPGTTYSKLASMQGWYIREETYKQATALIINAQHQQVIAKYWGDGSSSSSDGQRFKAGGSNTHVAGINPKYGNEPGVTYYSHTSDLYAPFHINVITSNIRDSTYVLDGLLYHEADLNIYEHYTDTAGFTDHVFALMHLLGFKFAPRIRDLKDKKIYLPEKFTKYTNLSSIIGGRVNLALIEKNWDSIIRLAMSIKQGTVTSSLILRKLGSYQRKNSLSLALIELGKIERSIFMLEWISNPQLRRRVQAGLNKGEAKHALSRAVHFNRLGEIRERTFENQLYRASGLNLVIGAIILWNTVYIYQKQLNICRKQIRILERI